MVHMKILKKYGGEVEHALRRRCVEPCFTEEYINVLEDIVTRIKIGRTWKELDIESPNKPFIKKYKPKEAFKPNTSSSNEQIKCHKCGVIGHLANNCFKKAKINEVVETEDHNDKEEESDSEKDTEESETYESAEINIVNSQFNNVDLIYEVLNVNPIYHRLEHLIQTSQTYKMLNCIEPNQQKGWDIQLANQGYVLSWRENKRQN
ncbi:hypothetical protein O181_098386 [Austropuccinia psidii MF-1]|uniref:CCHC-type domain-containing protein n=1 Tax=Austropuccinia psidii MF-1 TaxID=1389203 RepID=A0A9Q3JAS5_9BASI|nr:hypothetical protein [Austropuccinia psidii MF-1]